MKYTTLLPRANFNIKIEATHTVNSKHAISLGDTKKIKRVKDTNATISIILLFNLLSLTNIDKMKTAKEKLEEKAMALGQKVYEEAAKKSQAEAENKTEETKEDKKEDNVVDAEYEEK